MLFQKSSWFNLLKNPARSTRKINRKLANNIEDILRTYFQRQIWSQVINQKEVRVVGLKRSGNHGVINWITEQANGEVWHINNVQAKRNPYRYKYQNLIEYFPQYKWSINHFRKETKDYFTPKDYLLYSYEDYELEQVFNQAFEKKHDLYLGKSAKRYDVLIIRDPFNWLASRLKKKYMTVKNKKLTPIDLWIDYAREYLGESQFLKNNKICINYNQWFKDRDYRQQLASQLDLEFSDRGINKVHGCGGGSSFEGRKFDQKATEMDVINRWRVFAEDPLYRKLLDNEKLLEYSERIFGHIPGTETIRIK